MAKLFEPFALRDLKLANRIVIPPMCMYSAVNGNATEWHFLHYGHLAFSGAGLLIIEATAVAEEGRITHDCMGLWSDENEEALSRLVLKIREHSDIPIGIQLGHAGRKASVQSRLVGNGPLNTDQGAWETFGPSAKSFSEKWPTPTKIDRSKMDEIVEQYRKATERAERIGFDMIEIHSAHGYLLSEFLSPLANERQDEYGGSLANRMRFPLEVFDAVRAELPKQKPLGVRINGTDWHEGGIDPEEAVQYAQALKDQDCDYIDVSSGGNAYVKIDTFPGYQVPYASMIQKRVGLSTIAVGLIREPQHAEDILNEGSADLIAIGRGMLNNPRWPWNAAEDFNAEISIPPQYGRALSRKGLPSAWMLTDDKVRRSNG